MGKKIDIEKEFCPNANKLQTENETAKAVILDGELDELECSFNYDMCVKINTKDLDYITLDFGNLRNLKRLIIEAETYYENIFKEKS